MSILEVKAFPLGLTITGLRVNLGRHGAEG
jgi:hypothetical protein